MMGRLSSLFAPQPSISEPELKGGLRMMSLQSATSMGFASITTGGVMASYALTLGANNLQIGALAAIPFVMQLLQLPCVALVERVRRRKLIAVVTWFVAQGFWIPIGLIPVFLPVPGQTAIGLLLILMAIRAAFSAATNCCWNSWLKDLIPRQSLNSTMARRMIITTAVSAVVGLGGALFLDWWRDRFPDAIADGYVWLLVTGAIFIGLASPIFMAQVPEPMMPPREGNQLSLREVVSIPLRDANFRRLARFLFVWTFASNLAIPFFAVYMLRRLDMSLTHVMLLTMLSQVSNLVLLRLWGPLADRFGSKAVLSLSISIYLIVFVGWAFTTLPERHAFTLPLLVALHVLIGVATAGVSFTTTTIGMKLAPPGNATPYLAVSSLAINIGTGLGPLVGGPLGDYFSQRTLSLTFNWVAPSQSIELPAFNVTGFDFLFLISFLLGLVATAFLSRVREEGEVTRELVMAELWEQTRAQFRTVSSAPRFGLLGEFPASIVRRIPGLDVAVGVTAYQLASMMQATVSAVGHGRRALSSLSEKVSDALSDLIGSDTDIDTVASELSRHTIRGAIQAADTDPDECAQIATETVKGVCQSLKKTAASSSVVLYGAGYGAVQGAIEIHTSVRAAVSGAIAGARQVATHAGLAEAQAEAAVAQGVLSAVEAIAPDSLDSVEQDILNEFPELNDQTLKRHDTQEPQPESDDPS